MARKAGMSTGVEVARISVKVSPDTKQFRRDLKNDLEEIERTLKGDVHIQAHLDSAQARADFERLKNLMQKDRIKVGVDMVPGKKGPVGDDGGKSDGGGKKGFAGIWGSIKNIEAPNFGSGINLAGYGVILAGVLALAAPLLGLITTALLTIPGLIALVATPIAALTLGIDGFKKAAEVLKEPFQQLKDTMTAKVEEQFTPVFESMRSLFPMLKSSLPTVTQGIADLMKGVTDSVTDPKNMVMIEETIRGIGSALTAALPGVRDFTSGLIELARDFTVDALPGIVEWLNGAGADFKEWVSGLDLKAAFSGLGDILTVILGLFGDLAKAGMNWIQDPSKVNDFKDGLQDLANVLKDVADLSSTLNDLFKNMLPDLSWDGIKKDLTDPFTSKDAGWRKIDEFINGGPSPSDAARGAGGTQAELNGINGTLQAVDKNAKQASISVAGVTGKGSGALKVGGGAVDPATQGAANDANKIPPPDDTEAKAKLAEYQTFVSQVSTDVQTAMKNAAGTQGGTVPPPNFDAFKAAWNELPTTVTTATDAVKTAMSGVTESVTTEGANAATAAQTAADGIKAPLAALAGQMGQVGADICIGLAAGIDNNSSIAIDAAIRLAAGALAAAKAELDSKSPSKKFIQLGEDVGAGMGIGLENGFKPVLDQAKELSGKIASAFDSGADPTGFLNGFTDKETSRMEKVLAFESKKMGLQAKVLDRQFKATGNQAFKDQAEVLRGKMDEIAYQKESLDLAQEFAELQGGGEESDWKGPIAKMLNAGAQMPFDFASANANQFMSDIGISGGGALGGLMDYGKSLASSFVFNVGNMEDALTAQQTLTNRQALGVVPR